MNGGVKWGFEALRHSCHGCVVANNYPRKDDGKQVEGTVQLQLGIWSQGDETFWSLQVEEASAPPSGDVRCHEQH